MGDHLGDARRKGRWDSYEKAKSSRTFIISEDDKTFVYPNCRDIPASMRSPKPLDDFKSSLSVIGCYSEDDDKKFVNDTSSLNFIDQNKVPKENSKFVEFDLKVAEEKSVGFTGTSRQSFLNMLHWIKLEEELVKSRFGVSDDTEECGLGPDFVLAKNTLSKLILLPYSYNKDVKFYASSVNGTIYLMKDVTVDDFTLPENISNWSHKFKQFMCGEDVNEPSVQNRDFRVMLKGTLGPYTLLYSASTDCADGELYDKDAKDLSAFIKLKTSVKIKEGEMTSFIKRNALFLYFNCLLTSTPRAIIGFRNESVVTLLKLYTQEELRNMCKEGAWYMDPMFAFIYATRVLTFVQFRTESDPGAVFSFTKNSRESFITSEKEEDLGRMLPEWFEKRHEMP